MKVKRRRDEILAMMNASDEEAFSGQALAEKFGVSRQIIVRDIKSLKEEGNDIISTRNGYVLKKAPLFERVFKLKHATDQTEDELKTIVGLGGVVADVFVWHKVYGRVEAKLNIRTVSDVDEFINGVRSGKSSELMNITGGYHYHTVLAENENILNKIYKALFEKGYIAPII